jgi:hypothetical protein
MKARDGGERWIVTEPEKHKNEPPPQYERAAWH